MEENTGPELKELCAEKGLALGVTKEDRIKRLVEAAQKDGELDKVVAEMNRVARTKALFDMSKIDLVKLCKSLDIDVLVKEVMVEQILAREAATGEPLTKKARTTGK